MKKKPRSKPPQFKRIAQERIKILFAEADKQFKTQQTLADRYVYIARRLAMKYKVPIPLYLKRRFCKTCKKYLTPGYNVQVRLRNKTVLYYCKSCKHYMRFPFVKEKLNRNK